MQHGTTVDPVLAQRLRPAVTERERGGIPAGTRACAEAIERVRQRLARESGISRGKRGAAKRWERDE